MVRFRLLFSLALLCSVGAPCLGAQPALGATASVTPASATTSSRTVTASATCNENGKNGQPEVLAKVTNNTGSPLVVSYLHGVTTPQTFQVHMTMADPGNLSPVTIPNGENKTIRAAWDDLRGSVGAGSSGAALLVTNFGILTPLCGDAQPAKITLGLAPLADVDAQQEVVKIAAEDMGTLESWRAYPALYALLHPDVKAATSFPAVACWYANQYGTIDAPIGDGITATTVTDIAFGSWTWAVNGKTYPNAAMVTTSQQIGSIASSPPVTATEHLVAADGQWRWFFGLSQAALAAQPTTCDLSGTSTPATPGAGVVTNQPASAPAATAAGSITITNYTCPAGMTIQDLDPAACALDPSAAQWTLTGASLTQPLTWDAVTQDHGPGYSWDGLEFGEYIIEPAPLPDGVTGYAISGSDNAVRQDTGIALTLGDAEPNISLSIYLFAAGDATLPTAIPTTTPPPLVTGAVEVVFYDCQPGMTPDTFDASLCSPVPAGFDNVILTPGADVDPNALPGGPIFTMTSGVNMGGGAFQITGLPAGTYEISPGQNYSGPIFYSPDGTSVGNSTYEVTITADNPTPVLNLYRLS